MGGWLSQSTNFMQYLQLCTTLKRLFCFAIRVLWSFTNILIKSNKRGKFERNKCVLWVLFLVALLSYISLCTYLQCRHVGVPMDNHTLVQLCTFPKFNCALGKKGWVGLIVQQRGKPVSGLGAPPPTSPSRFNSYLTTDKDTNIQMLILNLCLQDNPISFLSSIQASLKVVLSIPAALFIWVEEAPRPTPEMSFVFICFKL